MKHLYRSSFLSVVFLSACATSTYDFFLRDKFRTGLRVTPDRVLTECEHITDHEMPGRFGFMMRVLDEEKTVLTVAQTNLLDKSTCEEHLREIRKILKYGRFVYIGGMGNLSDPRTVGRNKYAFPSGSFTDNGRTLQFGFIKNDRGQCFSSYRGRELPCPPEPFPNEPH